MLLLCACGAFRVGCQVVDATERPEAVPGVGKVRIVRRYGAERATKLSDHSLKAGADVVVHRRDAAEVFCPGGPHNPEINGCL